MQLGNLILLFLFSLLGFANSAFSSVNSCSEIFAFAQESSASFISQPLISEAEKLNPDLLIGVDSPESFYLRLRAEARLYEEMNAVVPQEIIARLHKNYSDRFNLPPEHGLRFFYVNALQGLYSRVAWEWKKKQIEEIVGYSLSGKLLQTAQALMDGIYAPMHFGGDMFSNDRILDFFNRRSWLNFPWQDVLQVASQFHKDKVSYSSFPKWYESQTGLPALSVDMQMTLQIALGKTPTPTYCCITGMCLACPLNRKFEKP